MVRKLRNGNRTIRLKASVYDGSVLSSGTTGGVVCVENDDGNSSTGDDEEEDEDEDEEREEDNNRLVAWLELDMVNLVLLMGIRKKNDG